MLSITQQSISFIRNRIKSYSSISINLIFIIIELKAIQDVVGVVEINVGGDFLGLCNQNIPMNMSPILNGYGAIFVFDSLKRTAKNSASHFVESLT